MFDRKCAKSTWWANIQPGCRMNVPEFVASVTSDIAVEEVTKHWHTVINHCHSEFLQSRRYLLRVLQRWVQLEKGRRLVVAFSQL